MFYEAGLMANLIMERLKKVFPNLTLMLDMFHFIIGSKGQSILSKDFGIFLSLVKEHFHNAVYARTEEECPVSSYFAIY